MCGQTRGLALEQRDDIGLDEMKKLVINPNVQVLDVRGASEYKTGHINGATHLFVGTIEKNLDKINKEKEVVIHCQAGDRSSIAASLLAKNGIRVKNYTGGYSEWVNSGNPTVS